MLMKETLCTNGTVSRCTYSVLLLVALVVGMAFSGTLLAQGQHGITPTKGCESPVVIGDPLICEYSVFNDADTGNGNTDLCTAAGVPYACCTGVGTGTCVGDTLTITVLEDFVCTGGIVGPNCAGKGAAPAPSSGNLLDDLTLTLLGGATCNGPPVSYVLQR
jgi:hypothetical protein